MRFLVTGASGFIGSNLAVSLQEKGEVLGLCNLAPGSMENLKGFKGEFIRGDICAFDYSLLGKVDAIFHQAAITDTTVTDQKLMLSTNVDAFQKILDYALKIGCKKVVYASSAATYGKGKVPMSETDSPQPANIYGESKVKMEIAAREFSKKHPEISLVGLRYFNVYGPNETHKDKAASMVYQLYLQIVSGRSPRIFKWGDQYRDFIYVKDVVLANLKAFEFDGNGAFNVGTGVPTTFNQVIQVLNAALGTHKPTEYFDNPYNFYQEKTQADMTLSKKTLGFTCQFSPESGIRDYVQNLKRTGVPV
ncbi:MAG: ADP-glyceromanno-heptose 6-epimerase [Elusimicrobia bacterium]|nr:ADP-glyceromanno-heptose 6-epimerase [Elusimicrobiota bacterium]